jgi:sugar lactone lactonase YvrE
VDGTGTGYVIELIGSRVRKMTLTGYTLNGTLPPGLAFDPTTGTVSGTSTGPFAALTDTITAYNGSGYSVTTITLSGIAAPAPIVTYNTGIDTLASGVPYTLNPVNSGGTVPATAYGQVSTTAGSTTATSGYVNASGTAARFNSPNAATGDALGNIYIADGSNNAIRMLTPAGVVSTFAGSSTGASGYTDATGSSALFNNPAGIAIDASGNLFVADYGNNAIRKITPAHVVTTFYHSTGTFGPRGLLLDATGNVIVAAKDLNQILKITAAGVVTTIAGSSAGYVNATGTSAQFSGPMDVKMDASGNLFVADYLNNAIRKIDPSGAVSTFAGSNVSGNTGSYADGVGTVARFNNPAGLAIAPGGIIYVADLLNNEVRRIMPDGTVSLAAGSATQAAGNADGSGSAASFNQPNYVYIDNSGTGYVTELIGNRARKIPFTGYSLNGALQSGLTFSSTTGIISGTVTGTITPVVVAVTAYNTGGFFLVATVPIGAPSIDWTGFTNTDWNTGSNWSTGTVPGSGDNARIGVKAYTGAAAQPLLGTNATVTNVTFGTNNSPILTISSGTLTVTKGFSVITGSTVTINGPGTLAFSGSSTISGSATLRADANLIMSLGAASFLTNNGAFTLGSGLNGCASIAAIPSTSAVNGASPVSVERYLSGNAPAYRGYRLMSSPVVYATTIGGNNVYSINYLLLSTYVTGDNASGGFSQYGNPSLYLFRENLIPGYSSFTDSGYRGFNDLTGSPTYSFDVDGGPYNIPAGNGYLLFFRGGFATQYPYTPGSTPAPAVVTATGQLNQGTIIFKDWFTPGSSNLSYTSGYPNQGLNLIGNPYPSSIDWDQFSSTDNTKGIYGPSVSGFVTELMSTTGSYGQYEAGSGGTGTNGSTNIIPSGAGFFVLAQSGSATLTLNETAKTSAQLASGQGLIMSTSKVKKENTQFLRLEMGVDTAHCEDILVRFSNSAKSSFDSRVDALYKLGFNKVSLSSLSSDHVRLGINQQPLPGFKQTAIGLNVGATENGTYHFNLRQLVGLSKLYDVWLIDAYKKDSVNLRINSKYDFAINKSDSSSFGDKRFSLIIRQNPAFAYQLLSFTANKVQTARQVEVIWKTQNEENYTNFTVERSTDGGRTFDVLGGVKAASQGQYSFPDKNPVIGLNLYRLKQEDINNAISYSKIVPIQYANQGDQIASNKLTIYPNPAGSTINLAMAAETTEPATYKIRFMNAMGTVVKEITSSQTSWQGNISNLQPGTYLVRVINDKTQRLVAENKFVRL